MRFLRYLLVAAGVGFLLPPPNLQADPTRRLRMIITSGAGAQSRTSRPEFLRNRQTNFPGALVEMHDNPKTQPERIINRGTLLRQIQEADIFMFSGHSNATDVPGFQVLKVQPTANETFPGCVTPAHIRGALRGHRGPRLVIVNGCNTLNPNDGVAAQHRISNAFGIANGTTGRTYLGWDMDIVGYTCDDHIGRLLTHWTTPDAQGNYPTLLQSKNHLNHPNLFLVGDPDLRYNLPFLLRSAAPQRTGGAHPMRLFWRPTGENTAQAVIEFGADDYRELQKLGFARRLTMAATRTADGFEIRDPQFQRLVQKCCEAVAAALGGLLGGGNGQQAQPTIRIHEATLKVRGDGDNLRVTLKIRASATVGAGRQEIVNGTYELIGTPERRPQGPPA